jgi:hypothetical protein
VVAHKVFDGPLTVFKAVIDHLPHSARAVGNVNLGAGLLLSHERGAYWHGLKVARS